MHVILAANRGLASKSARLAGWERIGWGKFRGKDSPVFKNKDDEEVAIASATDRIIDLPQDVKIYLDGSWPMAFGSPPEGALRDHQKNGGWVGHLDGREWERQKTWEPSICIYHGNCDDGFTAAMYIRQRWPECEFVPGVYGKDLPDVTGKDVLFVDFSAKRDVIVEMSFKAASLVIIDHHTTAQSDLDGFPTFNGSISSLLKCFAINATQNTPNVAVWFDMGQSGAAMAWKFAYGNVPLPMFCKYIQDRDLWRFEYGDATRAFSAALRTYPMDFDVWKGLLPQELIDEGAPILRAHEANIEKFIREAVMENIGGFTVPTVNVPYHYASDTAHDMLKRFPDAPFAVCWFQRADGAVQFSLRSEDSRQDVSEVATKFGGGGHRNAAGFQIPADGLLSSILKHEPKSRAIK